MSGIITDNVGRSSGLVKAVEAAGGGVLQVKTTNKTDVQTIASDSFTAISSFVVSVTPSSASNKILLLGTVAFGGASNLYGMGSIYRQIDGGGYSQLTTAIGDEDSLAQRCTIPMQTPAGTNWKVFSCSFNFLDAPSTTTQVDYTIYCRSQGSISLRINEEDEATDGDHDARPISTITAIELDSGIL